MTATAGPVPAIESVFQACGSQGRSAFIPFLVAGDPNERNSEAALIACAASGADIIELGIPYSDPIADGPTIQRASQRALAAGMTFARAIDLAHRVNQRLPTTPLVCLTYFNPALVRGVDRTACELAAAGFSGIVIVDLPLEESQPVIDACAVNGLAVSLLVAPSTPAHRAAAIARASTGFVYVVSRAGVTGAHARAGELLRARLQQLRAVTDKPLVVGFGVSEPAEVSAIARIADGVIVGSALVDVLACANAERLEEEVHRFCSPLAAACRH